MPARDLVVIGASAGGVEPLRNLVRDLPADLPACVLVVLHLPPAAFSALPTILGRAGKLRAMAAEDGALLEAGTVLVAPPDRHLLVRDGRVALGRGPMENGHRPAIDALFRSAARWRGPRTVGVVLSGTLDDGAAGLLAIVEHRGAAVVQDPATALYDGMPCAALRAVPAAAQASGAELAVLIVKLCREAVGADLPPVERILQVEADRDVDEDALADDDRPGRPVAITCPDCNGAMFEFDDGHPLRYRCRVGHAWSPETLLLEQVEAAEAALCAAIRTLEEEGSLHRSLANRAGSGGHELSRRHHAERARDADSAASVLRDLLRRPSRHEVPRGADAGP